LGSEGLHTGFLDAWRGDGGGGGEAEEAEGVEGDRGDKGDKEDKGDRGVRSKGLYSLFGDRVSLWGWADQSRLIAGV